MAVGGNYIWRRYGNFSWSDRQGITSADYSPVSYTPAASSCPAGSACQAVTYYVPNFQTPTVVTLTNAAGFNRTFNGVELTGRKRLSNHWLMNTSFSYNSTLVNFGSFPGSITSTTTSALVEDPTNRTLRDGNQYRLPDVGQRHRQRLHQREVALQTERHV